MLALYHGALVYVDIVKALLEIHLPREYALGPREELGSAEVGERDVRAKRFAIGEAVAQGMAYGIVRGQECVARVTY